MRTLKIPVCNDLAQDIQKWPHQWLGGADTATYLPFPHMAVKKIAHYIKSFRLKLTKKGESMNPRWLNGKPPALSIDGRINTTTPAFSELWEELLVKHGTCWARVVSNSMYPTIKRDDQVLVEKALPEKIRFGDIVVFRRNGMLVIHRIIGKCKSGGEQHFLEKGDANHQSTFVPAKDIIGRVTIIKNADKAVPIISGAGRLLQLIFACISYTSLKLWAMLIYCYRRVRRILHSRRRYGGQY